MPTRILLKRHAFVQVDMVYQDQLRSLIIPAIAPPREGWAWPQRGTSCRFEAVVDFNQLRSVDRVRVRGITFWQQV